MTPDQAREILCLYRNEQNRSLEGMPEALALLERDPELKAWFDQYVATRAAERAALRAIVPPAGLRDAILRERKVVQVPLWKRREFIGAVAASLLVAAGGMILWKAGQTIPRQLGAENFKNRMLGQAIRSYGMDIESNDPLVVRQLLARKNVPADFTLPAPLQALPVMGGAALKWNDRPVAMMCFKIQSDTGYLFVVDERNLPEFQETSTQLGSYAELSTATWRKDGKIYLLGAKVSAEELMKLVAG